MGARHGSIRCRSLKDANRSPKHRTMIALQHIGIYWTKWDRGPRAGALRKALPRTLPFVPPGDASANWVHNARYDSREDSTYQLLESWGERLPKDWDGVRVRPRDGVAEVYFDPEYVPQGKLRREHFSGLIARLPFGQKLVIRINGVSDGDHQRYYSEHVFHIGFADIATLDLPTFREIDEMLPTY